MKLSDRLVIVVFAVLVVGLLFSMVFPQLIVPRHDSEEDVFRRNAEGKLPLLFGLLTSEFDHEARTNMEVTKAVENLSSLLESDDILWVNSGTNKIWISLNPAASFWRDPTAAPQDEVAAFIAVVGGGSRTNSAVFQGILFSRSIVILTNPPYWAASGLDYKGK